MRLVRSSVPLRPRRRATAPWALAGLVLAGAATFPALDAQTATAAAASAKERRLASSVAASAASRRHATVSGLGSRARRESKLRSGVGRIGAPEALTVGPAQGGHRMLQTADGRRVELRGANVAALIDYAGAHGTVPVGAADAAQAQALGLNVVRLGLSWSRIQPRAGVIDQAYLAQVERVGKAYAERGVYVLLDMHQDRYAAALGQPFSAEADGAPRWAVATQGASCDTVSGALQGQSYYLTPCAAAAADSFFSNRTVAGRPLQSWYADVVSAVTATGRRIGPAFAGIELYNEPRTPRPGTEAAWATNQLFPFYRRMIQRLRADGYTGPVWLDPVGGSVSALGDDQVVLAPHVYTDVYTGGGPTGATAGALKREYARLQGQAKALGAALVPGEFAGAGGGVWESYRRWQLDELDRTRAGGIIWVWKQHATKDYGWGVLAADGGLRRGTGIAQDLGRPRVMAAVPAIREVSASEDRLVVETSGKGIVELWTGMATGGQAERGRAWRLTVDGAPAQGAIVRTSTTKLPNATIGGRRIRVTVPSGRTVLRLSR